MSTLSTVLLAAGPGDIALVASSYFRITEVAEPTHAAAPGLLWHGYWWRADRGHWGAPTVLHLHEGTPVPQLLTPADREACGWGDLP